MVVHSIPRRTIDARDGGRETRRRKSSHLMCKRLRGETKRGEDKQRKLCPGENQGVARPPPPPPSHYVEASRPVGDNGVAGERRPNGITELLHGRTGTDVGCARGHGALLCGGPRVRACVRVPVSPSRRLNPFSLPTEETRHRGEPPFVRIS